MQINQSQFTVRSYKIGQVVGYYPPSIILNLLILFDQYRPAGANRVLD